MNPSPPISGHTRLFAILADPVHHVQTPQRINPVFQRLGLDAVMVPLHVPPGGLETVAQAARQFQNLDGFVVTVPHKTAMRALCDTVSPAAQRIGAVNVVHRTPQGTLVGDMLDGEGFVAGLRREGIEPAGARVYLAGAGGAASAIAYALAAAGVRQLTVANRSADKARALLARIEADFPAVALATGTRDPSGHDLVVNATSLGLHPQDELPLDTDALTPDQVVAEIIMDPAQTPLLKIAAERGCRVHPGLPMLQCQLELMAAFMSTGRAR